MSNVKKLIDDLQHGNDTERYNAAVKLGTQGDKRAAPVLREFLTSGDYWPRAQAVSILGKIGDPADIPAMIEAAISDGGYEPRMTAARGLRMLDADAAAHGLIDYLSDKNPRTRRYAAETLGYMQATQAIPHLTVMLRNDPKEEPRNAAAEALGNIGDTSSIPALIDALRNDPSTRFHVIHALGRLKDKRALSVLIEMFDEGGINHWGTLSVFAEALGEIGDAAGIDLLIYILENIKDLVRDPMIDDDDKFSPARSVVYRKVVEALGRIGGVRAVDPLLRQLDQRRGDAIILTPAIAEALGMVGDRRAVDPLIKALTDDYWNLQIAAAEALGQIGDIRAVNPLIRFMEIDRPLVGHTAVEALERIGTPDAMVAVKKWRQQQEKR